MELQNRSKKYSANVLIIGLLYLYPLFALDRIKNIFSYRINDTPTTNEIWILLIMCFLFIILNKGRLKITRLTSIFLFSIFLLLMIIIVGGIKAVSISQWIYAGSLFMVPIFLFLSIPKLNNSEKDKLIKLFVLTSLIYSTLAIILSKNYAYFMALIGNNIDDYRYYEQYRASMMIGSSITVS